ncbi:MAG: hypothetical protein IJR35_11640 [Synergistaceae bacterium]|nr:hypothetical protein [Synergistaceae bacterium]
MEYNDNNRGKIQYPARSKQIIDYYKIRYGNITPTDMDGFFEVKDKAYVFYEFKLEGASVPRGQELALTRLVDDLSKAGKSAVLFICRHNIKDPEQDINAASSIVEKIYWDKHWHQGKGKTVKEHTDKFMEWIKTL